MGPFESLVEDLFGGYFDMDKLAPKTVKGWIANERAAGRGTVYSISLDEIREQPFVWNSLKKWLSGHFGDRVPDGQEWNVSSILRDGKRHVFVSFTDRIHPRILNSYFDPLRAKLVLYRGRPAGREAA